jgi:hypothetical protein
MPFRKFSFNKTLTLEQPIHRLVEIMNAEQQDAEQSSQEQDHVGGTIHGK